MNFVDKVVPGRNICPPCQPQNPDVGLVLFFFVIVLHYFIIVVIGTAINQEKGKEELLKELGKRGRRERSELIKELCDRFEVSWENNEKLGLDHQERLIHYEGMYDGKLKEDHFKRNFSDYSV
jgi:hypothetical protein